MRRKARSGGALTKAHAEFKEESMRQRSTLVSPQSSPGAAHAAR